MTTEILTVTIGTIDIIGPIILKRIEYRKFIVLPIAQYNKFNNENNLNILIYLFEMKPWINERMANGHQHIR